MSEIEYLLEKMLEDEKNAPSEYQKIIDLLPNQKLKNMLRINQRQEREHRKRVQEVLRQIKNN